MNASSIYQFSNKSLYYRNEESIHGSSIDMVVNNDGDVISDANELVIGDWYVYNDNGVERIIQYKINALKNEYIFESANKVVTTIPHDYFKKNIFRKAGFYNAWDSVVNFSLESKQKDGRIKRVVLIYDGSLRISVY